MTLPMLIEERIGIRMSDAYLLEARTIGDFARLIDTGNTSRCLVTVQANGLKRPFFLIHAHTGRVLEYRELADLLGEAQPFYALQPKGYDGNEPPLLSIEDMAAHYLKEIRAIQPRGPYTIGGYCLGGLIAYEIARLIRLNEQEDDRLVMIDTECPRGKVLRRLSLRKHMREISRLEHEEKITYLYAKCKSIIKRIGRMPWIRLAAFSHERQSTGVQPRFPWESESSDIQKTIAVAYKRYKPKSYDGNVTFISVEPANAYEHWRHEGWDTLINGNLQIISLPRIGAKYDYENLFHEPYLTLLGNALRNVLGLYMHENHKLTEPSQMRQNDRVST